MNPNRISNKKLLEIIQTQTEVVQQGVNLSCIMILVTEKARHIAEADGASIELIQNKELVYSAASGIAEKFLGLRLDIGNSLSGECIRSRKSLISNDIERDDRVNKEACRKIGINSMIVVPLICGDDVVGVLKVLSSKTGHFTEDNIHILELMSGLIAAAMFSAIRNEASELFHEATHDSLTGIPNRSLFYDRLRQKLSQAARKREHFGIISFDMDGLKEINDDFGHRAGDAAIREVAARVSGTLRESDTVARLGGDEFGIIAATSADRDGLACLIRRLEEAVVQPFAFEGQAVNLRVSMGGALFSEDGTELDVLLEKADKSMYEMKRAHKGAGNVR